MSVTSIDRGKSADEDDLPSRNPAAEMSVLGACLNSAEAAAEAAELVRPEHFYRPAHQQIFEVILTAFLDGTPIDAITVSSELDRRGHLVKIGGAPYLYELMESAPVSAGLPKWAQDVREAAARRWCAEAATAAYTYAMTPAGDTEAALVRAQERLSEALELCAAPEDSTETFADLVDATMDELHRIQTHGLDEGVSTGFTDFDEVTRGLHPGQFVLVAARPGLGKTTWATDVARAAAIKQGLGVVFFSLEMSRSELMMRMLSAEARVRMDAMRRKDGMCEEDWVRLSHRVGELRQAPLHIVDAPNMTMVDIRAQARKLCAQQQIGLIVVDYLQLIESVGRAESRQVEVSNISRKLKLLAKELEVPVVCVAQLNRGPEQRQDKRPQLSDLRESGSLEQDSDMVVLLHRPDAFERDDPRMGEADLILAKHRAGPTTTVTVAHQLHYSRFVDMAQE